MINKRTSAFTLIELIFVIVIIGLLSSFGVSIVSKAYETYIFSTTQNRLQAQSQQALDVISKRLEFRLRPSIIARRTSDSSFVALASSDGSQDMLEWIDTFSELMIIENNVTSNPIFSGFVDVEDSNTTQISLPESNTTLMNTLILHLCDNTTTVNDTAMFFLGSQSGINDYGWDGATYNPDVTHRVTTLSDETKVDFDDGITNRDIYENAKIAWTAYAIELNASNDLNLYYNYQPWEGEDYTDGNRTLISENVSTFKFQGVGDVIKLQVCISAGVIGDFSVCKEKTVY